MKATSAEDTRTYLVECYAPGIRRPEVESAAVRAAASAAELRNEGRVVDYLGALLVPGDEVVFHVFVSEREATVHEASVRASVDFERIAESVAVGSLHLRREDP